MILEHVSQIGALVIESFLNLWPYLLLSIPLAVAVRMSDTSRVIQHIFTTKPVVAILLATLVGAFSPFCACTVVPIITTFLIAGVPLGPVMAFWIASPTMDPEIFLLSVGLLGPELALVRVGATLLLSLSAGYTAHWLEVRQVFKSGILRDQKHKTNRSWKYLFTSLHNRIVYLMNIPQSNSKVTTTISLDIPISTTVSYSVTCCDTLATETLIKSDCSSTACDSSPKTTFTASWGRMLQETRSATLMVMKFMLLAFLLEAFIMLYVPQEVIITLLGTANPLAIPLSALIGVPMYTTNLTALPLISGLLEQGMSSSVALTFLIAGPTTTLPAMAAVFGIARPRVFVFYISAALIGSIVLGYTYQIFLLF